MKAILLKSEERETGTPVVAPAKRPRLHVTAEFIVTVALIMDLLVIFGGLCLGYWMRFDTGLVPYSYDIKLFPGFYGYFYLLVMGSVFLLGTFVYLRLYRWRSFMRYLQTARVIVQGGIFWLFAYMAVSLILKFDPPISRLFMVASFICVLGAMLIWRLLLFKVLRRDLFAVNFRQRVLFVGWDKEAEQLEQEIRNDYSHPYEIIGCFPSPEGKLHRQPPPSVRILGEFCNLPTFLEQRGADIVILADLYLKMDEIIGLVNMCEVEFAQFKIIPSYFQILASGLRLETISGVPVLGVGELPLDHLENRLIKRAIDLIGGTVGLLLSIPIIAVFAMLISRESAGSFLFTQERIGRNGRKFKMYKLRSMKMDAEQTDHLNQSTLRDDPRLLRCGAFMRKWNLDEVPQFWNVLMGDMSLVGPRPERPFHSEKLSSQIPHYNVRYFSYPGLTGWAQVNGFRGDTDLRERVNCDLYYLENWSLWLDFKIMVLTFLKRKNAY
jgi:exopolysaccharide biosynthesis polyprenyl glycosylphosphotransferase